ncbi:hypothetical protein A9Q93_14110 [Nonlabens dokdonensis]|uniref:Uncharacterized protein n=1 Tax=Nonlabens dokdonensis TaxID=328515 RepID=A0A1Z8AG91_9FLAO|nr:hypothetical protein [Nonlabens dokdonensis]OUS09327.1 hypothetical protein A9Q93_14110 [Nonlabens dokdonensis]
MKIELSKGKEVPEGIMNTKLYYCFQEKIDHIKSSCKEIGKFGNVSIQKIATLSNKLPYYPIPDFKLIDDLNWENYINDLK